jgi:hypothetical protein
MLWLVTNGKVTITLLDPQKISSPVDELQRAVHNLAGSQLVDPIFGLDAQTLQVLLAADPFVVGGPDVDLSTPEWASRFARMDSGSTRLIGQQTHAFRFTVKLNEANVRAETKVETTTQTNRAGLLSYLGLDAGVAGNDTLKVSVTNSSSLNVTTETSDDNNTTFITEAGEAYEARAYYDSCFGTVAYQLPKLGLYEIKSRATGKVLDVPNGDPNDHVKIQQYDYHNGRNQEWFLIPKDGGFFTISSRQTGKVLDVPNEDRANHVQIQQYEENLDDSPNQQWQVVPVEGDYVKVVSRATGKVLDVPDSDPSNHVIIQQYEDNGGNNQQWQLILLPIL